jgi:hypothetical protein
MVKFQGWVVTEQRDGGLLLAAEGVAVPLLFCRLPLVTLFFPPFHQGGGEVGLGVVGGGLLADQE